MIIKELADFGKEKMADLNNIQVGAFLSIATKEGQKMGKDLYNKVSKCYANLQKNSEEPEKENNPDAKGLLK